MTASNLWSYRTDVEFQHQIVGYDVEAVDGLIGKIDEATDEVDRASIVVDTGWWIFGKKRLIPAGVIDDVNHKLNTVRLTLTKEQVKDAPDWREQWWSDETLTDAYRDYYGPYGW